MSESGQEMSSLPLLTQIIGQERLRQSRIVLFEQRQLVRIGHQQVTHEFRVIFGADGERRCTTSRTRCRTGSSSGRT